MSTYNVLFVCLGNICRSPAADGVFRKLVREHGLHERIVVDSAGTGAWHAGDPPDARMIHHARLRGYDLSPLRARQFSAKSDFDQFNLILTMDDSNFQNVTQLTARADQLARVQPFTKFCRIHDVKEVPDPYYQGEEGFEYVLDLIEDASATLLNHVRGQLR